MWILWIFVCVVVGMQNKIGEVDALYRIVGRREYFWLQGLSEQSLEYGGLDDLIYRGQIGCTKVEIHGSLLKETGISIAVLRRAYPRGLCHWVESLSWFFDNSPEYLQTAWWLA